MKLSAAQLDKPVFSLVVPVHNESEGIEQFHERLCSAGDELREPYEIIYVDDGSDDGTDAILRRLVRADQRVRIVSLSRNFGHQIALTAGYDHVSGEAAISLDADCQHPPELIGELAAKWRDGAEVVYTIRQDTVGIPRIRRWTGRLVYRIIRACSGSDLTDQADFRLLDRKAVDALGTAREQARFLRGLVRWVGFRQVGVPYVAERRAAGASSYSLRQLVRMAGAGVFNFSVVPLRLVAALGAAMLVAGLVYAIVSLILWPFGLAAGPWWHVVVAAMWLFGLQFVFLGLLGEYVGRIFEQVKARPLYVIRETLGFARPVTGARPDADHRDAEQPTQGTFNIYT